MSALVKHYLLLQLYCFITCNLAYGEIILTEDRPYDVINIKVPRVVWKQAINPTPILKSPVTIVVPIHVVQEDENEVDDEIADEEVVDESIVTEPPIVNDEQIVPDVTNVTQTPVVEDATPPPEQVAGQVTRFPCSCLEGQCGCCTGTILERFKMKACGNISFIPEDFVFDVRLNVNNNTVVRRRVSASDPPPICFNPRRAPFVQVCAEISNIRIRNRNAFACLDINADIGGFPVYSASFRCFGLGASGVQTGLKPAKPVSSGPAPVSLYGNNENDDGGGFLDNAAGLLGGDSEGGLFGGGDSGGGLFGGGDSDGGLFGGGSDDDGGPLDAIGDAVGDFFEGRNIRL